MRIKRVLINASMMSNTPSGVGVYGKEIVFRLIDRLNQKKIEYTCYRYDAPDEKNFYEIKLPFLLELFFKRFKSIHRLLWNIFYLPFISKKYDLIYSFSTHGSPFIKKQIITIHDLISLNFPQQHIFQHYYFKYIVPHLLKKAKHIISISDFTKSEISKFYKIRINDISVIYNGSNHLSNSLMESNTNLNELREITNGHPFYLAVGASYHHKNIEIILEASKAFKNYKFIIIGNNTKYFKRLKEIKEELKLSNVIFLNYVDSSVLMALYSNAKANLYTSLYEGFGFTPLEASLFNCVSIVSNTSSLPEIYDDAVIYISPNSKDLIDKIHYVNSSEFNEAVYLKRFEKLYQRYNWEKSGDKIFDLILKNIS